MDKPRNASEAGSTAATILNAIGKRVNTALSPGQVRDRLVWLASLRVSVSGNSPLVVRLLSLHHCHHDVGRSSFILFGVRREFCVPFRFLYFFLFYSIVR